MKCPHCGKNVPDEMIAKHLASKGGKSGKGTKARSDAARKAANARWAKISDKQSPA